MYRYDAEEEQVKIVDFYINCLPLKEFRKRRRINKLKEDMHKQKNIEIYEKRLEEYSKIQKSIFEE